MSAVHIMDAEVDQPMPTLEGVVARGRAGVGDASDREGAALRRDVWPGGRVTFVHLLRSEWIKFWSIRSTWWVLGVLVVVIIGFGLAWAGTESTAAPSARGATVHASDAASLAVSFGQLVMAILAVLIITNEYGSGEIRTSLIAAPDRLRLLMAKALMVLGVGFVVPFVSVYAAELCAWPLIQSFAVDNRFTGDGITVALGAALAVALVALTAFGIAALVRNAAGAIGIVTALVLVLPPVFALLPAKWLFTVGTYLIGNVASGLFALPSQVDAAKGVYSFGESLGITALWVVVPLACSAVLLWRRDA